MSDEETSDLLETGPLTDSDLPAEFDDDVYLQLNPDLWQVLQTGAIRSAREHWLRYGRHENRPYARSTPARPDFDEAGYLQLNPDVAAAVRSGVFGSGYEHWIVSGRHEGRLGGEPGIARDGAARLRAAQSRPPGVNAFGFFPQPTGLGSAARGYALALESAQIAHVKVEVLPWHNGIHQLQNPYSPAPDAPYGANLIQQNPDMLPLFRKYFGREIMERAYNIGMWVWELPNVHPSCYQMSRLLDEIWVPSEFCRSVFQPVSAVPVLRIPYAVPPMEHLAVYGRAHFAIPDDVFVYLYVFDVGSAFERKNPMALVRAFKKTFGDSPDVLLVLKFSNPETNEPAVEALERYAAAPNIRLLRGILTPEEISSLYRVADCFVSPHRGEGFGLNIAQAMYFGKPVIATGFSGNLDFTTASNSFLIEFNLTAIPRAIGPYFENSIWAEPSISHLSYLLRRVRDTPDEAAEKGRLAAATIRRSFSVETVAAQIRQRLETLELAPKMCPNTAGGLFNRA
jgi:glycosyltransferase involved in cell wall biosynthesis